MKNCLTLLALCSLSLFAQTAKPVLTIGGEAITTEQYNAIIEALPQQFQTQARSNKRAFVEQLIQLKMLAAEADKQKLDQQDKVKNQLSFSRVSILANAMFHTMEENLKIDDAAIEKYYNDHKGEYEVVKAHHILVHTKGAPGAPPPSGRPELGDDEALARAQELRKRVVGGEDFLAVARTDSDDSSASQGGDLGEFGRGMMVPPFEQAAFGAKVGEISEPVRSPFGFHIIRVDSHITKPLAEVRQTIEGKLRPDLARQALETMRKTTKVEIDDAFFGPAPDAPGATK